MKVAILGAAHPHMQYALDEVSHRKELQLVAAAEADDQMRAQYLGDLGEVPVYSRIEDLLASHHVDVALVAGIYSERADAVVAALQAGAHVLADKPLCTSLDQLARIEQAAASAARYVSVVFEKRFYPATLGLRRLVDDGVLGDLALVASTGPHKLKQQTRPPWFLHRATYGGIAGDLAVHDIDLLLHLSEAMDGTVSALTGNGRAEDHPDFDDHVAVLLRAGALTATVEANWLAPEAADVHGHYRMRLAGTRGTAELDWAYHQLRVTTHEREVWAEPLGPAPRPAQYFFDALLAGQDPEITNAASFLATRIALLAQHSAETGGAQLRWHR